MDRMLTGREDILQASDERFELFSLMDRFFNLLSSEGNRYSELCRKHAEETAGRRQAEADAQNAYEARCKQRRKEAADNYQSAKQKLNKDMDRLETDHAEKLRQEEQLLQNRLTAARREASEKKDTYNDVMQEANRLQDRIEESFAAALDAASGGDNARKDRLIDRCRQLASARVSRFSGSVLSDVSRFIGNNDMDDECERNLRVVRVQAPKFIGGVILTGRLMRSLAEIYGCLTDCRTAASVAQREVTRLAAECDQKLHNEEAAAKTRSETNRRALIRDVEPRRQNIRDRLQQLEAAYQTAVQQYSQEETQTRAQMQNNFRQSATEEQRRQQAQKKNMSEEMVRKWQQEFPPEPFKELYQRVCTDQRPGVLNNPRAESKNRKNIMIGFATIDCTPLYQGEGGKVVRMSMEQVYPFLFPSTDLGNGQKRINFTFINVPYTISTDVCPSLLIEHDGTHEETVQEWINAIGVRLLWSVTVPQQKIRMIDRSTMGSFSALIGLNPSDRMRSGAADIGSFIPSGHASISGPDIMQEIRELMAYYNGPLNGAIEQYGTLWNYNEHNPGKQENFQALFVMNFPEGLNESSSGIKDVGVLVSSGRKLGLTCVFARPIRQGDAVDKRKEQEIEQAVHTMQKFRTVRVNNQIWLQSVNSRSATENRCLIRLFGLPDKQSMEEIGRQLREAYEHAALRTYDFDKSEGICPKAYLQESAIDGIRVPVGYYTGAYPFVMEFNDNYPHTIISGETGSGKTNLLHVLLVNTLLRYPPEEAKICLIDFKHGTDFAIYSQYNLPNFEIISITDEATYAKSVLDWLGKEMKRRAEMFITVGNSCDYKQYRESPNAVPLPRILVVIDELYMLTQEAGKAAGVDVVKMIEDFACRGRSFGIHLVLASQHILNIEGIDTILANCSTRIAVQCKKEETTQLMGGNEEAGLLAQNLMSERKGQSVVTKDSGRKPGIVDVVLIKNLPAFPKYLEMLSKEYIRRKQFTMAKVLLMNPELYFNHVLNRFLYRGELPTVAECRQLWIGDPISLSTELSIAPDPHIWIGGGQSEKADDAGRCIMYYSLVSLMLQNLVLKKANLPPRTLIAVNGLQRTGQDLTDQDLFGQLGANCPSSVYYYPGDKLDFVLGGLEKMIEKSQAEPGSIPEFWVLIQRLEYCEGADQQIQYRLHQILNEGPKHGIHMILWTEDIEHALQKLQLQNVPSLNKLCLELGDYSKFIGKNANEAQITGMRALWVRENRLMRVYNLPIDARWKQQIIVTFRQQR